MAKDTCKVCMFYVPKNEDGLEGRCHCNPPTADGFPFTSGNAWCGQFKRKKDDGSVELD